jgi:aminoglycoside phosphotransferase family enzyme
MTLPEASRPCHLPAKSGTAFVSPAEVVAFLGSPQAYGHRPAAVEVRETHMSWIFLTGSLVYKLKKPVRRPFLDLTTSDKRRYNCEEELRLNRRLAGDIYLRVLPLRVDQRGKPTLGAGGEIVDWLVEMKQLPAGDMLDERIRRGRVVDTDIVAVADRLAAFYQAEPPQIADGIAYIQHIRTESRINRGFLLQPRFGLDGAETVAVLDRLDALMQRWSAAIHERIVQGQIVEGHGDLRPEHVCLMHPPRIIDCLEFDRHMRLLDPYDEVGYLGLECAFMGAGWIRPLLLARLEETIGHKPDPRLLATYAAFRATMRARICLAHLIDPNPMEPGRWPDEARRYMALAAEQCTMAGG